MSKKEKANQQEQDLLKRILGLVDTSERFFKNERMEEIVRNISYYRGKFWEGDGYGEATHGGRYRSYKAVRNEIFPIVDTIVSALAMDLPQVECIDQRQSSYTSPNRAEDPTFSGKRIANVLNFIAERDELDSTVQELVLHALLFGEGIVKVSWSMPLGRPIWRLKLPWEVHFDPSAKNVRDANWSFERFTVHAEDYKKRVESGVYTEKKEVKPDTYPRTLVSRALDDAEERELRRAGLKEFVGLIEFWDYKHNKIYHVHPETKQILMEAQAPYGRPYSLLVFNSGVGRIRGISDVSLIAPIQRDINELVSARREVVARLPKRMLIDEGLFNSEEDFERWKDAKTWEPCRIRFPVDGTIDQRVWVSPDMQTTFDFNRHLEDNVGAIRWTPGMSDYQRGEVANIRTAAEANMIRGAVEGRLRIRSQKLVRVVTQLFEQCLDVMRWAISNRETSGIDIADLQEKTTLDVTPEVLAHEILAEAIRFRLLPFSPLMEDKIARRDSMTNLLPALTGSALSESFDIKELAKELVEAYGWRPSVIKEDPPPVSSVGVDAGAQDLPPQMGAPVEGAAVPPVSDQESSDFLASLAGALPGVS
tara:strand:+ start:19401 stop:21179 length:1779 start_codon:yes stop_codon:yes gene_type:complete